MATIETFDNISIKDKSAPVFVGALAHSEYGAIKMVDLYVTDSFIASHPLPYYVCQIGRKATIGGNTIHVISLKDANNETVHLLNQHSSQYTESDFIEIKTSNGAASNIYGQMIVDWSAISEGTFKTGNTELNSSNIHAYSSYETLINNIPDARFPFKQIPPYSGYYAIKNIYIEHTLGADIEFGVRLISKSFGNTVKTEILLQSKDSGGTRQNYYILLKDSSYDFRSYNEFNLGAVRGWVVVDWDVMASNTSEGNYFPIDQACVVAYSSFDMYDPISVFAPSAIVGVVGKTQYLRHWNMTRFFGGDRGVIDSNYRTTQFMNLGDRFKFSPTSTSTNTIEIRANKDNRVLQSKTCTLKAVADNPTATLNALFIGDSMTEQLFYIAELMHMLPNMTVNGTRSGNAEDASGNTRIVKHEGRSGWSASNYVSLASKNNVANAFWNASTSSFDFSYYMSTYGGNYGTLTDVFLLLGTNDAGSETSNANFISAMQTIVSSIASYSNAIKIHLILPPPNIDSGYAWGIRNLTHNLTWKNSMFDLWTLEADAFSNYDIIPAGLNVDCWYDFPHTTVAVNERNPATEEVGNDNVHPTKYGYYNMSDVIYAYIVNTRN